MAEQPPQPALEQAARPLTLAPVGLKEAALDSPSFRATAVHFSDQVEIIEKWLDAYMKSTSKLVGEVSSLEETINNFLFRSLPPSNVSEAVFDHDYTLLAMRRLGEGSRDYWSQFISGIQKMDGTVVEPLRAFMTGELRNFKDARRYLEQTQKTFDNILARYLSQSKTKEPSALREDAFQVYETRKAYMKAALDFCILAPQLRSNIDRLLVRISSEQWREMKKSKEGVNNNYSKWNSEMERVRGWSRDMEIGEAVFKRELQVARREIGEAASAAACPSRELEDYNISTVPYLSSKGPSGVNVQKSDKIESTEKQGWLFQRTVSGKPARTAWIHRWFYVKNGIFGWLVQGTYSGGVEESEKIGVLLCNVKPAVQEDRRFVFEVKTKNSSMFVQAETQSQLSEWLETFENAKNRALEASAKDSRVHIGGIDPAFAITQPSIPEFAARSNEGHVSHGSEELGPGTFERINTLAVPDNAALASRSSVDVGGGPRRSVTSREEGESSRDHAARIIQKLDLHRKSNASPANEPVSQGMAGGIASLISASHNILPSYATSGIAQLGTAKAGVAPPAALITSIPSTLAPATLANPPAPTNLSKTAVIVSGEKGASLGTTDATGGMPSGIMANIWGSTNWGYLNRLERGEVKGALGNIIPGTTMNPSPRIRPADFDPKPSGSEALLLEAAIPKGLALTTPSTGPPSTTFPTTATHRKAMSVDSEVVLRQAVTEKPEVFPANYPIELKTQEAQFRMLFPNVSREDKLVLVFRASWSPNDSQEFPGRVYVTDKDLYFYSHHMGLCFLSGIALEYIEEVTAAPGKDCDFLFLHLSESATSGGFARIQIKTFLEPLRLLQSRLNFLIDNLHLEEPLGLEKIIGELLRLETEDPAKSPSMESWEDVSVNTPADNGTAGGRKDFRTTRNLRNTIHVEHGLGSNREKDNITKFQLPSKPIVYEPSGFKNKVVEKVFDISPKALFHVMFGDRSAVFQLLYHERRAQHITQTPWTPIAQGGSMRREFHFQIDYVDMFRRSREANIVDFQTIDILNDHICYVIEDHKVPWHLPHFQDFMLVSKIVITHLAKSKCKLAIYTKVDWSKAPTFSKGLVERQALGDIQADATDLAEVISEQVRKLGPQSRTKKAIQIFGHVGQQTSESVFKGAESGQPKRPQIKQRTLTNMLFETYASFGESCITSVMMWTFDAIKMIWNMFSANAFIIILLLMSVLVNLFFSGRDASDWWTERNAAKFMNRIGVGPNYITSKAVYLKDLDEAITSDPTDFLRLADSRCYSAFQGIVNTTDMDAPYEYAGLSYSEKATKATARRLRRTRQQLGTYRYNLIVATRVVNNIEREMIKAEWENWLLDENNRCRQVRMMLEDSNFNGTTTMGEGGKDNEVSDEVTGQRKRKVENLRRWQEEYCGSCRREQEVLMNEGRASSL